MKNFIFFLLYFTSLIIPTKVDDGKNIKLISKQTMIIMIAILNSTVFYHLPSFLNLARWLDKKISLYIICKPKLVICLASLKLYPTFNWWRVLETLINVYSVRGRDIAAQVNGRNWLNVILNEAFVDKDNSVETNRISNRWNQSVFWSYSRIICRWCWVVNVGEIDVG